MPSSASQSATARMPGVSMMTPPPGTITISRATVVWRPLSSLLRTALVACGSPPTSLFTSVDFPTPDPPRSAAVTPGPIRRLDLVEPDAGHGALDDDVHAGRDLLGEIALVVDVLGDVGLGEHDDRLRTALPCEHELALEAADVDALARERLDDEDHVDVGDEHLLVGLLAGVLARERARARQDRFDDGLVVALGNREPDPVTDDGALRRCRAS